MSLRWQILLIFWGTNKIKLALDIICTHSHILGVNGAAFSSITRTHTLINNA